MPAFILLLLRAEKKASEFFSRRLQLKDKVERMSTARNHRQLKLDERSEFLIECVYYQLEFLFYKKVPGIIDIKLETPKHIETHSLPVFSSFNIRIIVFVSFFDLIFK